MNVSITVNAIGASAHYSFYGEQFWSDWLSAPWNFSAHSNL